MVGRDWKVTALGGTNIAFGVALGASEAFGPVKAALSVVRAIYDAYEVRPLPPFKLFSNKFICRERLP